MPPVRRPKDVLTVIAAGDAPAAYLRSLHPQHEQFEGLRRLVLKLRGAGDARFAYKRETVDGFASTRAFRDASGIGRDFKTGQSRNIVEHCAKQVKPASSCGDRVPEVGGACREFRSSSFSSR